MPDLSGKIVLRWDAAASCAPLLEPGGIDAVIPADAVRLCSVEAFGRAAPSEAVAVDPGVWPGVQSARQAGDGAVVAGATSQPWVTANGYLIPYLRALFPARQPILGYAPQSGRALPFSSLELALVDAWAAGGNAILSPDAAYRDSLLRGDKTALAAWTRMGQTARWLKEHRSLFSQPALPNITVLVDSGDASAEIANLMFRQGASPDLVSAARPPGPVPGVRPVVAAAGLAVLSPALRRVLLAHARAGAAVLTDAYAGSAWWRTAGAKLSRRFQDREFHTLGAGRIVVYKEPIADPGDFALDAVDLAGSRRPARLWNCSAAVAMASATSLRIVNYGSPARGQVLARWHGVTSGATLLRPEEPPIPLRTYRRGRNTEVVLPGVNRLAVVGFD